jgi:hypothetical protein
MSIIRHFARDTQTNDGTGGIIYDLSTDQGTSAILSTGGFTNTSYEEKLAWQITVDDKVNGTSFNTGVNINAITVTNYRWRLQRVNSSNVVQASSAYSSGFSTVGTPTALLTFSTTWNVGDRLRLSFEALRSGTHGTGNVDLSVNNFSTFVEIPLEPIEQRRIFFIT